MATFTLKQMNAQIDYQRVEQGSMLGLPTVSALRTCIQAQGLQLDNHLEDAAYPVVLASRVCRPLPSTITPPPPLDASMCLKWTQQVCSCLQLFRTAHAPHCGHLTRSCGFWNAFPRLAFTLDDGPWLPEHPCESH